MVNLSAIVTTKKSGCAKCFSMIYTIPCLLDKDIAKYFSSLGKPMYPLEKVRLIRIDFSNGFRVEGKIDTKTLKLVMPKKYEKVALDKIQEKINFETCLINWMSNKLNMLIEIG